MTLTSSGHVAPLLAELVRRGIHIEAADDRLRYHPRDRMTPELVEKLKRNKPDLLAALGARGEESGPYTLAEERILASVPAGLRVTVDAVKRTFADSGGATILDVRLDTGHWRQAAAALIRSARANADRCRAVAVRDAWRERMAICTIDGGLPEDDAESVAALELERTA